MQPRPDFLPASTRDPLDTTAIDTPADLGNVMNAVLQAVSIASLVETRRRTIETLELDARVAALEQSKVASP